MIAAMRDAPDTDLPRGILTVSDDAGMSKTLALFCAFISGSDRQPDRAESLSADCAKPFARLDVPPPYCLRAATRRRVHAALLHRPSVPYGLRDQRRAVQDTALRVCR
jgi:hypothetical protein